MKRSGDGKAIEAKKARRGRRAVIAASVGAAAMGSMWAALHLFPGFGPAVADGVRAVVGPGPVAWAEDVVYGIEDRIKGVVYRGAPPKQLWDEAPAPDAPRTPAQPPIASMAPVAPTFARTAFAPPFPGVAAAGDGQWMAVADPGAPGEPAKMYKTSVHPDPKRGYAVVAVIALDLSRLSLSLVAGTVEPASSTVKPSERPGLVPADRFGDLVAAFNGGFKAEHGHYGMMLDGKTFLPARDTACTVALDKDGGVRIGTWKALAETEGQMAGYRQAPPCLVEGGSVNDALAASDDAKGWGAAVSGATTIRRSAVGLDRERKVLFYAIGESVTASSLARAMKAAGADNAAQLDVNTAYPRFVFYGKWQPGQQPTATSALIADIAYARHEYVSKPEGRDFFYVTRKAP
jgi:hypothetical protein